MTHGFEFTPMGIVPLGTSFGPMAEGAIAGATAEVASTPHIERVAVAPYRPQVPTQAMPAAPVAKADAPLKPVNVVKLARARLREVERDIGRLKKLETERDELKRLLAAAAQKPRATIRSLPTRSA